MAMDSSPGKSCVRWSGGAAATRRARTLSRRAKIGPSVEEGAILPLEAVGSTRHGKNVGGMANTKRHNSDVEADVALGRCAPSGPRSLTRCR
jgi:hypothetical protein